MIKALPIYSILPSWLPKLCNLWFSCVIKTVTLLLQYCTSTLYILFFPTHPKHIPMNHESVSSSKDIPIVVNNLRKNVYTNDAEHHSAVSEVIITFHPPTPILKVNIVTVLKHWPFINCFCPGSITLQNARGSTEWVQSGMDGKIFVTVSWTHRSNMTRISERQTWGSASYTVGLKIIGTIYMENNGKCVFHHIQIIFYSLSYCCNCPMSASSVKFILWKGVLTHFIHNFLVVKCRKLHE